MNGAKIHSRSPKRYSLKASPVGPEPGFLLSGSTSNAPPPSATRGGSGTEGDLRRCGMSERDAEHEHHHPGPVSPSVFLHIPPLCPASVERISICLIQGCIGVRLA